MKHFVITRIGIGIYNKNRLNKMIDLFSIVTLPSLINQKAQNFISLIVIDENIPKESRKKLENLIVDRKNFFIVPIDITNLLSPYSGSFNWVWDHCQNFIIKNQMIDDLNEYFISSILDADDAWHRLTTEAVESIFNENLNGIISREESSSTWTRHSSGAVLTFEKGYAFFPHSFRKTRINDPFLSMSIFVLCRFSSGISACSSRHSAWGHFSKTAGFVEFILSETPRMWIYTRHNESAASWNEEKSAETDQAFLNELEIQFGIQSNKIKLWNKQYKIDEKNPIHLGVDAKEIYNLIFKISAINKSLLLFDKKNNKSKTDDLLKIKSDLITSLRS